MSHKKNEPWPFQKFITREIVFACQQQADEGPYRRGETTIDKVLDLLNKRTRVEISNLVQAGFIQLTPDGRIRQKKKTPSSAKTVQGFFGFNFGGRQHRPAKVKKILHVGKIAPCSFRSYPVGGGWRFWAGQVLIKEAKRPMYLDDRQDTYFCSADSPWAEVSAPFEFVDLQIALHACKNNLACPSEMLGDGISFARLSKRFDRFLAGGFLEVDRSVKTNHVGNYRPRWYRPTEQLITVINKLQDSYPIASTSPQYVEIDFDDL